MNFTLTRRYSSNREVLTKHDTIICRPRITTLSPNFEFQYLLKYCKINLKRLDRSRMHKYIFQQHPFCQNLTAQNKMKEADHQGQILGINVIKKDSPMQPLLLYFGMVCQHFPHVCDNVLHRGGVHCNQSLYSKSVVYEWLQIDRAMIISCIFSYTGV